MRLLFSSWEISLIWLLVRAITATRFPSFLRFWISSQAVLTVASPGTL